jgi:hydrogenase maturation protein HypF
MKTMERRVKIDVHGIVQGVGFRPFIYRLAHQLNLIGSIHNSESGVQIEIQGTVENVSAFLDSLTIEAPPLARLDEIQTTEQPLAVESEFRIVESKRTNTANTLISPDIATCADCTHELLDPSDRRHRYPFINCTNCGPRFTITRSVPYDRSQTSMAAFPMCPQCQAEYDDPFNRRFHAQPNACWDCGPQVELVDRNGIAQPGNPIGTTIQLLQQGHILAIKGLGGFHLAVDANQPKAVHELRRRKHRGEKPFAVMVADLPTAQSLCHISEQEAVLLESPQRPIVLLRKRTASLDALAPDGNDLGIFLPYTPMHHLLFASKDASTPLTALVMTSANLSEEPIAIENNEAISRLNSIADYFLLHNRDILLRCDDSVVAHRSRATQFARRSRGFVPAPIRLSNSIPSILAVGGELKNAICISRDRYAFLGQHIGDLENLSAYDFFQESITHFQNILEVRPTVIAHDLHPGYLATQWAKKQNHLRLIGVQHHHAHIASCMSENHLSEKVIGIALDGTGYGTDGQAWGGEILIADFQTSQRAAHLRYTAMPGGEQAIHEPWRIAVSQLWTTFGETWQHHAPRLHNAIPPTKLKIVEQLLRNPRHLTLTSSCGRLFDAVAALVLNRTHVTYEAQAAIALEACCELSHELKHGAYPFAILESDPIQIDTRPLFAAIAHDLVNQVPAPIISSRFHAGLIQVLTQTTIRIAHQANIDQVCLSGGSFQNAILALGLETQLTRAGLRVYKHTQVPPGDGGLSLGQLLVAANTRASNSN